jgi:hypothetical protein
MIQQTWLAVGLVVATGTAGMAAEGIKIVRDGQAQAVIVVHSSGTDAASKSKGQPKSGSAWDDSAAAGVLADWIQKITDVRLETTDHPSTGKAAIYIGLAAVEKGLNLSGVSSPTSEGVRIVSDGHGEILIAGQSDAATVKAVCRFLEELGCRYFMDHQLGEVYPRSKTVTVGKLDITEKPGFMLRKIWGSQWSGDTLWKIWNGHGGIELSTGHAWNKYVDPALFDTHPEYFALRNGRRQPGAWYCTWNPDLRKVFVQGVISEGRSNPSISPPDGTGYCQCDNCRAQDDPNNIEPSSGVVSISNRYADFFDYVGKEVAKTQPDWLLNFYCYADYTQPPTFARRLSPNLVAWIAPIRYSRYHCIGNPNSPSMTQLATVIESWSATTEHIAYRTYNYNLAECLVPVSKLAVWKHDVPYLKRKGCVGINLETLANWEIYGPHIYQSIRLAYDPDTDSNALMDDYFLKFYGPGAGPAMKQYWQSIDQAFADMRCESGSFYALHVVYQPAFLEKLQQLVDSASAAARMDPTYAARVAMTAQGLANATQYIQMRDAMHRGGFAAALSIYEALHARNEAEAGKGYVNHYTLDYLERFVGRHVKAGAAATAAPNRVLQALPDRMRLAYDAENAGVERGYSREDFDDSSWKEVATYSNTLDAQGLPDRKTWMWYRTWIETGAPHGPLSLFFTEIDGQAVTVYVNGEEIAALGKEAGRKPFEVDVTRAVKPGKNLMAVKIDHGKITELSLGGIIRPILLIEKPQ